MKKILVLVLCLFIMPMAILADIPTTHQYVAAGSDGNSNIYIDMSTVKVLQYNPPYYVIQADVSQKAYSDGTMAISRAQFFYNMETQKVQQKLIGAMVFYQGAWKGLDYDHSVIDLPEDSIGWGIANYAFFAAYNRFFSNTMMR